MTMTRDYLREFIARHRYGVLSSISPDGKPQSALVGIAVSPELEIFFDTVDTSRKVANLRRNPHASFVIGWENEQTLQLDGLADEPQGAELARLKSVYFAAWPDGPQRESWKGITYYRVRLRWLRFSSYVDPQVIEEMTF
jgi:pyridoxine/pyridoxamine 5'-phosphate oxidase